MGKSYKDITPNYDDYLAQQAGRFLSFESELYGYHTGMKAAISWFVNWSDLSGQRLGDVSCGDGFQSRLFARLGANVIGIDLAAVKIARARELARKERLNISYVTGDFHYTGLIPEGSLDILFSSHSLEHAYNPRLVLEHFYSYLKPDGRLWLILPYPDQGPDKAHGGKYSLGTTIRDGGVTLRRVLADCGFNTLRYELSALREPEIWLELEKM